MHDRTTLHRCLTVFTTIACACTGLAHADGTSFDRPGIAFSTGTVATGSWAIEQGLPDWQRSEDDGTVSTQVSAGSNLRYGLTDRVELQFATSLFNQVRVRGGTVRQRYNGIGDSSLALKLALPSNAEAFSWAMLARAAFPTGDAGIGADGHGWDLGTSLNWSLTDTGTAGLYVNADRADGVTTWSLSPSYSIAVSDQVGVFMEANADFAQDTPRSLLAGGGITWLVTPRVQLDLSADIGLGRHSHDRMAGFGVAIALP